MHNNITTLSIFDPPPPPPPVATESRSQQLLVLRPNLNKARPVAREWRICFGGGGPILPLFFPLFFPFVAFPLS